MISEKKKDYFKEQFSNCRGDIKGTWNVVEKLIPTSSRSKRHQIDQNVDAQKKAEDLNVLFCKYRKEYF